MLEARPRSHAPQHNAGERMDGRAISVGNHATASNVALNDSHHMLLPKSGVEEDPICMARALWGKKRFCHPPPRVPGSPLQAERARFFFPYELEQHATVAAHASQKSKSCAEWWNDDAHPGSAEAAPPTPPTLVTPHAPLSPERGVRGVLRARLAHRRWTGKGLQTPCHQTCIATREHHHHMLHSASGRCRAPPFF